MVAHALVTGGQVSASERDIRVGGIADAPASAFWPGFAIVALGHLHGQQRVGTGGASTAVGTRGSPLAFSFSERNHRKSVTLAEIDGAGRVEHAAAAGPGAAAAAGGARPLDDLLARADGDLAGLAGAWVKAVLTDPARPAAPMERLREKWPHTLVLDFEPDGGPDRRPTLTCAGWPRPPTRSRSAGCSSSSWPAAPPGRRAAGA